MSASALFQPIRVGDPTLAHRAVMCPLTRHRANAAHVHGDMGVEYYAQRASTPGTLLITEAMLISAKAGSYAFVPGIWSDEQVAGMEAFLLQVTDAVHAKGSYTFLQLWSLGRTADVKQLAKEDPSYPFVAPSDIPMAGQSNKPRPLTLDEIKEYVDMHATAAANAVHRAGFDGVEIHGANGYLVDQFLQDVSNKRTNQYGGSEENRARFALEIVDAVVEAVGENKTGIRISPFGTFQDMRMDDPLPTFKYLMNQLVKSHPNLAYVHAIEPRTSGPLDRVALEGESLDFIREIWGSRPLISSGGHTRATALDTVESKGGLVGFGRLFLANPDLPDRFKNDTSLAKANRGTYWTNDAIGYTGYPFANGRVGL